MQKNEAKGADQNGSFERIFKILMSGGKGIWSPEVHCYAHDMACPLGRGDIDLSGSPCVNHSSLGNRTGVDGDKGKFLAIYLAFHITFSTPMMIHENVTLFGKEHARLKLLLSQHGYQHISIPVNCADIGLSVVSRARVYPIQTFSCSIY